MKKLDAKLLFVEDDAMTRELMRDILQEYFLEVIIAQNGKEGLDIFKKNQVDIVLTDIAMPQMNGIEMIQEIRKSDEDVPIVIFSAHNESQYLFNSIQLSVCDYLFKPLSSDALEKLLKKCEKRLESKHTKRLAYYDHLTGIYNRYKIIKIVKKIDFVKDPYGVLFIDLDNFKQINDRYGHSVGDAVLKQFSHIIQQSIRKDDYFGRWGGEEFLIIMKEAKLQDLKKRAQSLVSIIQKQHFEVVEHITISIGVSQAKGVETFDDVVQKADKALYEAKKSGKNRVIVI